ncbi:MAG TPA: SMP-30/gluconolactonase/LRE family protein [Chitinophagaceae bacterium]|nr:SMP-30/gluconolactonase/LRE family protein [Chitinophagaceae bacterium]
MNTTLHHKVSVLCPLAASLGESPVWHAERRSCLWVDILKKKLYEYSWEKKALRCHDLRRYVSSVIPGTDGQLYLGLQGGIGKLNPDSGDLTWITDLGIDWTEHRCNDGAADSQGRIWMSTMEMDCRNEAGDVYAIEGNAQVTKKIENVSISNGPVWSADNKRLYHNDSATRQVKSYVYEEESGNISFERVAVEIPKAMGLPDGMAMDEEGMLWIALWGGSCVSRWNISTGKMVDYISLPAPHVSSCAFVGDELDHLLITTARKDMTEEQLEEFPESGHIFIIRPGVRGVPRSFCSLLNNE